MMRQGQETLDAIEQNDDTFKKLLISDRGYGLNHRKSKDSEEVEVGEFDPITFSCPLGRPHCLERLGKSIGKNTHLLTLEFYWNDDLTEAFRDYDYEEKHYGILHYHDGFFEGLKNNLSIRRLNLEHCDLSEDGPAKKVLEVVRDIGLLTTLFIHGRCIIGDEGMDLLESTLSRCTNLESIFFRSNSFVMHDSDFLSSFTPAMKKLHNLKELDLGGDSIGWQGCLELVDFLQDTHCCNLQTLGLATNNIDNDCAILLGNALKDNDKLKHLDLCCNNIGDDGATALSFGLTNKNALECFYLDINPITNIGWHAFNISLCNPTSIGDTFSSNHTLQRLSKDATKVFPGTLRHCMQINRNMDKRQVARKKILLQHNIAMQIFFDLDLKMLPHIIEWFDIVRPCMHETIFSKKMLTAIYQFIRAFPGKVEGLSA